MERTRAISKTMMSYLKKAQSYNEFLLKEEKEFERGKRHLANIMGLDPAQMNQEHIDSAIKYLFPAGLFEPKARPLMKSPNLLYLAKKDAQFDISGRPHHHLFYTVIPHYYETLGNIARDYKRLNEHEDEQLAKGIISPTSDSKYNDSGRRWLELQETQDKLLESIKEPAHKYLIRCLEKLNNHPYSVLAKPLLDDWSIEMPGQASTLNLPELVKDNETGSIYTEVTARHRVHVVKVRTVLNGTGIVNINKCHDILFFDAPYMRSAILFPLTISNMLDRVDIYAEVVSQPRIFGQGAVASAIRFAVSKSIAAFKDEKTRERLRLAGLLTFDGRVKERKKFGQEGARRKYTWKKR